MSSHSPGKKIRRASLPIPYLISDKFGIIDPSWDGEPEFVRKPFGNARHPCPLSLRKEL
jgi:hypothetical protein